MRKTVLFFFKEINEKFAQGLQENEELKKLGCYFSFGGYPVLELSDAFGQVISGCNQGMTGILELSQMGSLISDKGRKTILSLALCQGRSIEYSHNSLSKRLADLNLVIIDQPDLFGKLYQAVRGMNLFVICPLLKIAVNNVVNINAFLQEKEIIELNANGTIKWASTLAYHDGYGAIRINLKGREAEGVVSRQELNTKR